MNATSFGTDGSMIVVGTDESMIVVGTDESAIDVGIVESVVIVGTAESVAGTDVLTLRLSTSRHEANHVACLSATIFSQRASTVFMYSFQSMGVDPWRLQCN